MKNANSNTFSKLREIVFKEIATGCYLVGPEHGQLPKRVRESIRFAADAFNAYLRGMSMPDVAVNRYEPGSAEIFLTAAVARYGRNAILPLLPTRVASLLAPNLTP